jgi:cystathionine gamma-synthase
MKGKKKWDLETMAVHLSREVDPGTGAVTPPIHLSTTFERAEDGSYPRHFLYSRLDNPNRQSIERALSQLEGGAAAMAFSSGLAATSAILQCFSSADHWILPADIYYGTGALAREVYGRWGAECTFVDMTDLDLLAQSFRPGTTMVWVETPSNPLLKIIDLEKVASLAHQHGAICVCDNTWATPILQSPLSWGAEVVLHSTTKYLGGHTDVLGGIVVVAREDEFAQRLRRIQSLGGAVPSPFECWLLMRSLPTLPLRVKAQSWTAARVAEFLSQQAEVEKVYYPGLPEHPGFAIAAKQMKLPGGMLSFQVKGGREEAMRVAARTTLFTRATSLGGVESFIEHRASIEPPGGKTPPNLLRVSIGLESADDLIDDLRQALSDTRE